MRHLFDGIEGADSISWNPHKWMGTALDCSMYLTRDPEHLIRVMSTNPSYLRSAADGQVTQYKDWGIQLGRRFRALKLWFHLSLDGIDAIRDRLRRDLDNARWFADQVAAEPGWRVLAPVPLQTVCIRHEPDGVAGDALDAHTLAWVERINASGAAFMSPATLDGRWMARVSVGVESTERRHVEALWRMIRDAASATARAPRRNVRHVARLSPDERRQAIIDATLAVARRQGLGATTVRDVATEMGTSSGLIHHYFASMDEVLAAAFEHAAGGDLAKARAAIDAAGDPAAQLDAFIESYAPVQADWTMQLWLDAWAEAARRPALQAVSRRLNLEWQSLVRGVIERGVGAGTFTADDPEAAAWRLLSVLDGLTMQVVAHDALITRDDVLAWTRTAAARELSSH
jgi:AcrR family transcriptional regulator